jgi:SAM-dependent methyltransferase
VQSAGQGPPRPVPAPELPPLARIRALINGYQSTAVLLAAYSLGLFTEIQRKPQVAADLARHCGAALRGLMPLLDALVGLGVLHRHGATYVLPRDLATYLVPGVDGDGTGLIDAAPDHVFAWMDLARSVREGEGRQVYSSEGLLASDPERVRRYIRSVHTTTRESCRRVAEMAPLLPGSSLVDVGGGSGVFAAEYVRRTPDLKAYLFDLPPTIEIAREILASEGLEDTVEFVPGDYRRDPFPGPVDTVLISNVFQTESEEHCLSILRRAREALRPGGTLLIHGGMSDENVSPPPPLALFSMMMYLYFEEGALWSTEKVTQWLAAEGFGVRSIRPLGPPFLSKLILATRLD